MSKINIGEQIAAARKAAAFIDGRERPPAVPRERDYLAACVVAASGSLEFLRDHEVEIRAWLEAKKGGLEK